MKENESKLYDSGGSEKYGDSNKDYCKFTNSHPSKFVKFIVSQKEISLRKWFLHVFFNLPQSILFSSIRKKDIRVNGRSAILTANYNLKMHDVVLVYRGVVHKNNSSSSKVSSKSSLKEARFKRCAFEKDNIEECIGMDVIKKKSFEESDFNIGRIEKVANSLKVIYENENFIVIDKPYGIASQLGTQVKFSIIEVVETLCKSRVYPVHRLDKKTTGVMIFAKNYDFAVKMADMLLENSVYKEYRLLVHGKFPEHLVLKTKIGRIYSKHGDKMVVVKNEDDLDYENLSRVGLIYRYLSDEDLSEDRKRKRNKDYTYGVYSYIINSNNSSIGSKGSSLKLKKSKKLNNSNHSFFVENSRTSRTKSALQSSIQNNIQYNIENIKDACTEFSLINCFSKNGKYYSEVKAILHTGRKHQIRVHCDYIGHGIVGDEKYNNVRGDRYYIDSDDFDYYESYNDSVSNSFDIDGSPKFARHASRRKQKQGNDNAVVRCRNCKCGDRMMLHCFKISFEDFNFTSFIKF